MKLGLGTVSRYCHGYGGGGGGIPFMSLSIIGS